MSEVSEHYDSMTGVILAGGKSSRMGTDKALLPIGGKPCIQHVRDILREVFNDVIAISDHGDRYAFLSLPVLKDIWKGSGPIGGIHSALTQITTDDAFITSCDLPGITSTMIRRVARIGAGEDAVVFKASDGLIQPLFGVYRKSCLPQLRRHLASRQYSIVKFLEDIRVLYLTLDDILGDDALGYRLQSMNSPEDYRQVVESLFFRTGDDR